MQTFTLRVFEQIGNLRSEALRFLGQRQTTAANVSEGKRWLSGMIAEGRLESDRFYLFESADCASSLSRDLALNVSFYLFPDGRMCPVRIWSGAEPPVGSRAHTEWTADFAGVPGWSRVASLEPRWVCQRSVPAEQPWIGRSSRDWQKRDCYVLHASLGATANRAA